MNTGTSNLFVSQLIMEECHRLGLSHIGIAPGSRSTSLVLAAARHPDITVHTHIDERGLGFFGLGLAKSLGKPVGLITTSGTAAANLFPAVIEARKSKTPLLIFTADRPMELWNTNANQTIDQTKCFADYPVKYIQCPCPDDAVPVAFWPSILAEAFAYAMLHQGPVHLNIPFREPFFDPSSPPSPFPPPSPFLSGRPQWKRPNEPFHSIFTLESKKDALKTLTHFFSNPVILLGSLTPEERDSVLPFLKHAVDVPIFSEITSQIREEWVFHHVVLSQAVLDKCDGIIHIGGRFVLKEFDRFIEAKAATIPYVRVHCKDEVIPFHFPPAVTFFGDIKTALPFLSLRPWDSEDFYPVEAAHRGVIEAVKQSEKTPVHALLEVLPNNADIFLSNSLPIRLFSSIAYSKSFTVYYNRGTSGIDGIVSTIAGLAAFPSERPLIALVGDMAFLHDINGLSWFKTCSRTVIIVVLNNGGGQIFSQLPVSSQPEVGEYFVLKHTDTFEHAAAQFNIRYLQPQFLESFSEVFEKALKSEGVTVIEVVDQVANPPRPTGHPSQEGMGTKAR